MKIRSLYIILFLFISAFINANEKSISTTGTNDKMPAFSFSLYGSNFNHQPDDSDNISRFAYSPSTGKTNQGTGMIVGGIISLLLGLGGVGAGAPMMYFSGIGLGFVTYHPGIVGVIPIDGNYLWLWLAYGFGIGLLALGSVLFVLGIALIVAGAVTIHRQRVSFFFSNGYEQKLRTACAASSMGIDIKLD